MVLLTLATGLRVVVDPEPEVPIVQVLVSIAAGAGDDPPGHSGLAHLAEHLAFGRLADGKGYDAALAPYGVRTDGWTELDTMGFSTLGPTSALDVILARELVRLRDGLLPEGVDAERGVIAAERRQNERPFVMDAARAAIWPEGHPWRRAIDGGEGGSADDVVAWTRAQWTPDRTVVVVAGDVDAGRLQAFVDALGEWRGSAERPAPPPGRSSATAWPTVPQSHPDRPALDLAVALVGGATRNGREVGQAVVPPGAQQELRRLRVDGPTQGELDAERADVALALSQKQDSLEGRAAFAAYCVHTWGTADCAARERAAYDAVDVQAIRQVVARWLVESP